MHETITEFLRQVRELYRTEGSTEHSYRPALKQLFESLLPGITALNERKRVDVGAPDFVLFKTPDNPQQVELFRVVSLGYIEAKDLKAGILDTTDNKSQIERYLDLGNVIHTDNITWRFYFEREMVREISIAHIDQNGTIVENPDAYEEFTAYLRKVVETPTPSIRTAKSLALHMADRARPIRYTIQQALQADIDSGERTDLSQQYEAFRETLIHDLSVQDFADIYAETIAYGLFAARFNDDTTHDFNLQEAAAKVPQTNPFLRQFFLQIAAYESDPRLNWVLNRFAELFVHADVKKIMSTYGKTTGMNHDPVTHFYETFLGEYDPKRRKARGVYYTPLPVVQYIVRAVDKVLKEEFGLADGLADDSTIKQTFTVAPYKEGKGTGKKVYHTETKPIPRVQILDPATGTSTFLNETIKLIADRKAERLGSGWNDYVEKNLLPRIHGFEILMAAYSMAHMRLGLTLTETGYKPSANAPRLGVYLTNSLEEPAQEEPPLLAMMGMGRVLTEEAMQADRVKRDMPIMVVMGNPPYSVSSANKGKFIQNLIADYKKDLNERKINLDDDYIKFIRYAENMIEKNGQGVVAMITNNSFIDGITHRQMRKHLLETFDKIWVLDLHGNSKKKEVAPDGSPDENVFDVQVGVSVVVMVKKNTKKSGELAHLIFHELHGRRIEKYSKLEKGGLAETVVRVTQPNYFLVPKDESALNYVSTFISVRDLFPNGSSGFRCGDDDAQVCHTDKEIYNVVDDLINLAELDYRDKYNLVDGRNHNYAGMRADVAHEVEKERIIDLLYRPFDIRKTYYSKKSSGFAAWPRNRTMDNFVHKSNIGLVTTRQSGASNLNYFDCLWITDLVTDENFVRRGSSQVFPLFVEHLDGTRTANFDDSQLKSLLSNLEPYCYVDTEEELLSPVDDYVITAIDVLDYIYGALHSPSYRTKYKEFLKIDFPRVPKPKSIDEFARFAEFGKRLRELHLMKNVEPGFYKFVGEGDNTVEKVRYELDETSEFTSANADGVVIQQGKLGRVYINDTQYFISVPDIAWNFYIGGYQPAQKWLKDRKGRALGYKDIEHYQRIITILMETDRIMKEIG